MLLLRHRPQRLPRYDEEMTEFAAVTVIAFIYFLGCVVISTWLNEYNTKHSINMPLWDNFLWVASGPFLLIAAAIIVVLSRNRSK